MSLIGELVENIYKYGNCKFYMGGRQLHDSYVASVIEFLVDENGELSVINLIEHYDKNFWDGDKKSEDAVLDNSRTNRFVRNDLISTISYVVCASLYNYKKQVALTHEDVTPKANTDMSLARLYKIVYSMFQLSPHEIVNRMGDESCTCALLQEKASRLVDIEEVSLEQVISNIEIMKQEVETILRKAKELNEQMHSISIENPYGTKYFNNKYRIVYNKWIKLFNDYEILKYAFSKKDEKRNGKNKIIIIAAIGKNNELGKDNNLIWTSKEDMKFFRETTTGHTIVMGRNTFDSLPKVLPNRTSVVLTGQDIPLPEGVIKCSSIEEVLSLASTIEDDIYVIGGAMVYKELMPYVDEMYLTEFDASCPDASVYFPEIDETEWESKVTGTYLESKPPYLRRTYTRKSERISSI